MIETRIGGTMVRGMLRRHGSRARVLAMPFLIVGLLRIPVAGTASALTPLTWSRVNTPSPGTGDNFLVGVDATSTSNAWAVGTYTDSTGDRTLIERWTGTGWIKVASPSPGFSSNQYVVDTNLLYGVAATSTSNAWAVGYDRHGTVRQTLILHWNGSVWSRMASPNPGGSSHDNLLLGVTAISASNAWAVGEYDNSTNHQTLVLHWNGTRWRHVASPNPGGSYHDNHLLGVTAVSASNAWAVGRYNNGTVDRTLTLHWNGTSWKKLASPNPAGQYNYDELAGVAAISASNVWAVGNYQLSGTGQRTLVLHWNGTSWSKVASPNLGSSETALLGVTATSASNAWAVGRSRYSPTRTLVLHWNGASWSRVASPNPGTSNSLNSVAATSASNAWAVGTYRPDLGSNYKTLAIHCC